MPNYESLTRVLRYSFEEAWASLRRSRQSVAMSVATISAALLIVGGFLLVTSNVRQLLAGWSSAAELSVYLQDNLPDPDREAIDRMLATSGVVSSREYVSKAEALERFRQQFPDLATLASGGPENPLPASYEVRLRAGHDQIEALAASVAQARGVADVRYDRRWLERLLLAVNLVQGIGLIFAAVLIIGAFLTVGNVVRLACYARRNEIEIMELVGAPIAYVRGPFVVEGILQGGIGAIVALALLYAGYVFARAQYGAGAEAMGLTNLSFLPVQLCGLLLLGGMAVGCVGGLVAAFNARTLAGPAEPVTEHA